MTNRMAAWAVAAAAGLVLGLSACGDDDDDGGGGTPAPTPAQCTPPATATAPFTTAVQPILTSKCGTCHGTTFGSSDRATAHAAALSRVNTSTPAQSTLLQKGNGTVAHGGGDALTDQEVTTLTTWVTECAQNN